MRIKDKVALVTGAAGDIGRTTALRLSGEGAAVILNDINKEGCDKVLSEIEKNGRKGSIIIADVTKPDEIKSMFGKIITDYERLDILVNIAGGDYDHDSPIDDIDYEKMTRNIDVNLKSCIMCCGEASKIMMDQEYGKIVNMSSLTWRGSPMQYTYSASKGGIYAFTRSLALTLGIFNINVNALAPALIEVDVIKKALDPDMWEALKEDVESRYPLGRIGQPIDVANCILFLASDEASFITGQVIEVSGGARL